MRLSLITQFKTELLLPFTSCRKVLGKKPESENTCWAFSHRNVIFSLKNRPQIKCLYEALIMCMFFTSRII